MENKYPIYQLISKKSIEVLTAMIQGFDIRKYRIKKRPYNWFKVISGIGMTRDELKKFMEEKPNEKKSQKMEGQRNA